MSSVKSTESKAAPTSTTSTNANTPIPFNAKTHKAPFVASSLAVGVYFNTTFLFVSLIELSAVLYSWTHNKPNFFAEYLQFKSSAPLWSYYQIFELCVIPLFMIMVIYDGICIFTRIATFNRNVIDAFNVVTMVCATYTTVSLIGPYQSTIKSTGKVDNHTLHTLIPYYTIAFAINVVNFFLPILRYQDYLSDPTFHPELLTAQTAKTDKKNQ